MRILFDSQIFDWQVNGGISRAIVEIANRLTTYPDTELLFKVKHSYNTYIQNTPWLLKKPVLKNIHFKGKLRTVKLINEKINRQYSDRLLKKGIPDIFHPTFYDPYFLKSLKKGTRLVITIHDLTNEKLDDRSAFRKKVLKWKNQIIERADHITTVSNNTRKDLIEYYKVDPNKVTTVYHAGGFDPSFATKESFREKVKDKYILFVGVRTAYKNFKGFIEEVAPLLKEFDIKIVAAGGGRMSADELSYMAATGVSERVIAFPHISDPELYHLYRNAEVFVFPSLYEGFGVPPLEAMQCDCPSLLSNNSSLPEVGGEAALYFNPFVRGELQKQLRNLLLDEELRKRLVNTGKEQIKRFTWDETTRNYLKVYKALL
ncbi:MAG: glycosyltransferase family 1 protein [Bacteroidota bacterium]